MTTIGPKRGLLHIDNKRAPSFDVELSGIRRHLCVQLEPYLALFRTCNMITCISSSPVRGRIPCRLQAATPQVTTPITPNKSSPSHTTLLRNRRDERRFGHPVEISSRSSGAPDPRPTAPLPIADGARARSVRRETGSSSPASWRTHSTRSSRGDRASRNCLAPPGVQPH